MSKESTRKYYIAYSLNNIIYANYFDIPMGLIEYLCPDNIISELGLDDKTIIISWQREE